MIHSLGIDYGGTWIRIAAIDCQGQVMHRLEEESFALKELPSFLKSLFKKWKVRDLHSLVIGAKGVWKKSKKNHLFLQLRDFAETVRVFSDVEMAHWSVFKGSAGILVIAGTGSIAYGIDHYGRFTRAGGLGPKKGDEGSGYWIGKRFQKLRRRTRKNFKSVREIASLAPTVIKNAKTGNVPCLKIVRETQEHLAKIADQCSKKLHFNKSIGIGLSGGLFQNRFFRKGFMRILMKEMSDKQIEFKTAPEDISISSARFGVRGSLF